jgi:dihydroorotase
MCEARNLNGPVFDLVTTMSKFLYLGMALPDVIARVSAAPARSVRMDGEIGTLRPAACADVTLLRLRAGPKELSDASDIERETVVVEQYLEPAGVVRGGLPVFFQGEHA